MELKRWSRLIGQFGGGFIIGAISPTGSSALPKTRKTPTTESIGERIVRLRKERGITQKELAAALAVSQPVISDYEHGEIRMHGELIIQMAKILKVSTDELLGLEKIERDQGAVKDKRLLRKVKEIENLPRRDQEALLRTIEAFLSKAG